MNSSRILGMVSWPALLSWVGLSLSVACTRIEGPLEVAQRNPVELMFTFPGLPSLEQRVWVSATVIRRGDGIAVQSVATNRGDDPIEVEISCTGVPGISGVDFDWPEDVQVCQGSARVALAPQDSIVRGITTPRVISRPGTYTLQVRHFIDPAFAAPIEVTVIR